MTKTVAFHEGHEIEVRTNFRSLEGYHEGCKCGSYESTKISYLNILKYIIHINGSGVPSQPNLNIMEIKAIKWAISELENAS